MPWNLLILPLTGGYYFLSKCLFFSHQHARLDRQRLIFNSTIAGIILLILAYGLSHLTGIETYFSSKLPAILRDSFLPTSVVSFLLGIISAHLSNLFISKNWSNWRAIRKYGNELEFILAQSLRTTSLLQISLNSGKCYIGVCTSTAPNIHEKGYVSIFPLLSGYRDSNTKELKITTDYYEAFETHLNQNPDDDIILSVTIKIDEIITATPFDLDLYEKFNLNKD